MQEGTYPALAIPVFIPCVKIKIRVSAARRKLVIGR
jgi:hypothetical protein